MSNGVRGSLGGENLVCTALETVDAPTSSAIHSGKQPYGVHEGPTMEPITTDDDALRSGDHPNAQTSSLIDNCNMRLFENKDWSWHSVLYASTRHGMSNPIGVQDSRPRDAENTTSGD